MRLLSSQPIEIRVFDEDNILYEIKIENCKEETLLYLDQFEKRLIIDEGNPKVRITGDTRLLDSMKFSHVDSLSLVNSQVSLGNFSFSGNQLVMEQVEGNIEDFNLDLENLRVVNTTLQSNYGRNIIDCVHLPVFRNSYWLCEQPICYNKDMIGSKRHGILLSDHSFSPIDIDFARARLTYILENLRRKTYSNMNRELYPVLESLQDSMTQLQAQYDVLKEVENSIYKNVPPKLKVKTLFKDNKD